MSKNANKAGDRHDDKGRNGTADAFSDARDKVGAALGSARESVTHAYESASDNAVHAAGGIADAVKANPLLAVAGGLAAGVVAGLVVPRSDREIAALGTLGRRLNDAARDAGSSARAAGLEKLDELGLSQDRAQDTIARLVSDVAKAATHAGGAALGAVGERPN